MCGRSAVQWRGSSVEVSVGVQCSGVQLASVVEVGGKVREEEERSMARAETGR
jgi:hypothetical protein